MDALDRAVMHRRGHELVLIDVSVAKALAHRPEQNESASWMREPILDGLLGPAGRRSMAGA